MVKNRKLLNEELGRKSIDEFKSSEKLPIAVVLDNVRSLNNVGSVFRTSDAFLIEKIYLCGITGIPPHPEIHRSALGAENSVDWEYADSTVKAVEGLKQSGYVIISVEQVEHSVLLNQFYPKKGQKYALVFGNEVKGVGQDVVDISDVCIEIPQLGTKHSFNISVSAGIVLWDFFVKVMVD
ncbi:MAG: RNA methyltransferase [Tenuifilum sp.]|uniref:RNA methyltransferase n=2 Tax=Tenuifilum sp. TaxID=2760880 RepID=UPI002CB11B74|nr:RNA methyltransferase [Tenuifilum sp.]HON69448.1 RNA methyltransferase [Tenuifilum sp.]